MASANPNPVFKDGGSNNKPPLFTNRCSNSLQLYFILSHSYATNKFVICEDIRGLFKYSISWASIMSWILFFRDQQLLVSCLGLLEWYAHLALGLYFGEDVFTCWGGSLKVINYDFNMCCNAWANGILIFINCLLGAFCLRVLSCWGCTSVGLEIKIAPTN